MYQLIDAIQYFYHRSLLLHRHKQKHVPLVALFFQVLHTLIHFVLDFKALIKNGLKCIYDVVNIFELSRLASCLRWLLALSWPHSSMLGEWLDVWTPRWGIGIDATRWCFSCHELVHLRWVYFIFLGPHLLSYFSKLCLSFELGVHLTWVYFHFIGLHLLTYFSRLHLPFESRGKMGHVLSHEELFKGLHFSVVGAFP